MTETKSKVVDPDCPEMVVSDPSAAKQVDYAQFFCLQKKAAKKRFVRLQQLAIALAILPVGFLIYLESQAPIWAYIALLVVGAYFGLERLYKAINVTIRALSDLEELARYLQQNRPSREQVLGFLGPKITPHDDSNVPEAASNLCGAGVGGENVRAAANAAFVKPNSALSYAQFIRTALVLGGLFGTVLFFSVQLKGEDLLSGNLAVLLPWLRGALASTLTGILASVALGYLSSEIEGIIDQAVWETEAFLSGPFLNACATTPTAKVTNEVELWSALLLEMRQLHAETAASYNRLAGDISGYARALQDVSTQLLEMPALTVPPELANLHTTIGTFKTGTELLDATSRRMVDAMGTLGIVAPTQMLGDLNEIKSGVAALDSSVRDGKTVIDEKLAPLSRLETTAQALEQNAEGVRSALGTLTELTARMREAAPATPANPAPTATPVGPPSPDDPQSEMLTKLLGQVNQVYATVGQISARVTRLESVYKWTDRATRAPLMWLFTLPFRPATRAKPHGAPK